MGDSAKRAGAGWLTFTIGLAVGLALGGILVAGVLAEQRRTRRALPWSRRRGRHTASPSTTAPTGHPDERLEQWDNDGMRAARHWPEDAELDEELEQTFPASDPLPYSHRVD